MPSVAHLVPVSGSVGTIPVVAHTTYYVKSMVIMHARNFVHECVCVCAPAQSVCAYRREVTYTHTQETALYLVVSLRITPPGCLA